MNRFATALCGWLGVVGATAVFADTSPYVGWQGRPVKALAPERTADLLAGRGAGYALAAELNGYPGPLHVLELAEKLELTPRQRTQVETLFAAMRDEAKMLGRALIERETALDRMFADARATEPSLATAVAEIAVLEGRLRATHLRYHLETRAILEPEQIVRYARLRGYGAGAGHGHGHGGHH
jgi:Spy/CpxP family protein refolding chaperone